MVAVARFQSLLSHTNVTTGICVTRPQNKSHLAITSPRWAQGDWQHPGENWPKRKVCCGSAVWHEPHCPRAGLSSRALRRKWARWELGACTLIWVMYNTTWTVKAWSSVPLSLLGLLVFSSIHYWKSSWQATPSMTRSSNKQPLISIPSSF